MSPDSDFSVSGHIQAKGLSQGFWRSHSFIKVAGRASTKGCLRSFPNLWLCGHLCHFFTMGIFKLTSVCSIGSQRQDLSKVQRLPAYKWPPFPTCSMSIQHRVPVWSWPMENATDVYNQWDLQSLSTPSYIILMMKEPGLRKMTERVQCQPVASGSAQTRIHSSWHPDQQFFLSIHESVLHFCCFEHLSHDNTYLDPEEQDKKEHDRQVPLSCREHSGGGRNMMLSKWSSWT